MVNQHSRSLPPLVALLIASLPTGQTVAQQLHAFPTGPYFANCRGPGTPAHLGGEDDSYNVWYFEIDRSIVVPDGTTAPDFWIQLYDGDSNPSATAGGANDLLGTSATRTVFEYQLLGGSGAAAIEEEFAGTPLTRAFLGTPIDIDSDPQDDTLRTDDPDDNDATTPEDLRDLAYSRIGVDIDNNPGEVVGNLWVYKFTVDARTRIGRAGGGDNAGDDRNRYKILATRDAAGTNAAGIQVMTYEYSIAGRPANSVTDANIGFLVPPTADSLIDLQSLDFDDEVPAVGNVVSRLVTTNQLYPDALTYETGEQNVNGVWYWSSVMQSPPPTSVNAGRGRRGHCISTLNQVGDAWVYVVDPRTADNAFSVRLWTSEALGLYWQPIRLVSVFHEYGDGRLRHYGAGFPRALPGVLDEITLFGENADASAVGALVLGVQRVDQALPLQLRAFVGLNPPTTTQLVLFQANGSWLQGIDIPLGVSGFTVYSQLFQLTAPATGTAPAFSNGVEISLFP